MSSAGGLPVFTLLDDGKVKHSVTLDGVVVVEAKLCDTVGEFLLTGVIESKNGAIYFHPSLIHCLMHDVLHHTKYHWENIGDDATVAMQQSIFQQTNPNHYQHTFEFFLFDKCEREIVPQQPMLHHMWLTGIEI